MNAPSSRLVASQLAELKRFLLACERSSAEAYAQLRALLERLDEPTERPAARRFLEALRQYLAEDLAAVDALRSFHFRLTELVLPGSGADRERLTLLEMPSIFTPEEWSFTFFEGLARYPEAEMRGRDLVELGCGNGWITLALARRVRPRKIYGLDINPRAVRCARLNLYLNGLDGEGRPILDDEGVSLLERVEFAESDLLAWCRERRLGLDRVLGCIPQVLAPDAEEALRAVTEAASDETLYALSNYTTRQGYVEDQFGLGLIARAAEEAVELLRPGGAVILNLGGRPGSAVLDRLLRRRGYLPSKLWQTRVEQAGDTDILPLVEIERRSRHRFEFFLGLGAEEPVSARTAWSYARAGGSIAHALTVYEARLTHHREVRRILELVRQPGFEEAKSALDLAFEDPAVAEEKLPFLAALAERLAQPGCFPYEETAGLAGLRSALAEFLRLYHRIPLGPENFVVLPSPMGAVKAVLDLYRPSLALVDAELARELPRSWLAGLPGSGGTVVLEAPRRADQVLRLMQRLAPQLVVVRLADFEARNPHAFERLVEGAEALGARLLVDISDVLDLSSAPAASGVFAYLAENSLPPAVAVFAGLVKNRVYRDLELAFVLSESADFLHALTDAAELGHSRAPLLTQRYYEQLLDELLRFQLRDRPRGAVPRTPTPEPPGRWLAPAASAQRAFAHAAIQGGHLPITPATLRLDYGENSLPAPAALAPSVFESFGRQNVGAAEADPRPELARFFAASIGLAVAREEEIALGHGVAPLFAALAEACAAEGGTFVFPQGAYGYFVAAAHFYGAAVVTATTRREDGFRLTAEALEAALGGLERPWVFVNGPIVNPTGAVIPHDELVALLEVCRRRGARVVVDSLFAGLEHGEEPVDWRLSEAHRAAGSPPLAVLGGASKLFAAGGLRFGFGWASEPVLAEALERGARAEPHATLCYAMKRLFRLYAEGEPGLLADLAAQRRTLASRAARLHERLEACGWEPLPSRGGLFLVAKPTSYLGRPFGYASEAGPQSGPLDTDAVADALFWTEGLLVNNATWTGIPEHCRFVLSVDEATFERALEALTAFRGRV